MKKLLFALFILFNTAFIRSQAQTIEGQVAGNGHAIGNASVNLLNAKDSSLAKAVLSNDSGHFAIKYSTAGQFVLQVQAVGYDNFYSAPFEYKNDKTVVPDVLLTEKQKDMNAVTVSTAKPFIQQQIDKTVVNIANSVTAVGSNVWEVLDKVPGVVVDNNNNTVSLQGKNGVMIYIDGRPTYLAGDQLANLLKGMDANTIQNIEVMTHPPAQYDAAGNAGIINIVTKKNKAKGFNGTLTAGYGQGRFPRQNYSGNINYRNGKVNLYGNLNYFEGIGWNDNHITRGFEASAVTENPITSVQNAYNENHWKGYGYKGGIDYYLDSTNTLGFSVNGNTGKSNRIGDNTTDFSSLSKMDSTAVTTSDGHGDWSNITYDLNYKHDFKKEGSYLMLDLAYARFRDRGNQKTETYKYDSDGNLLQNSGLNPFIRNGNLPSDIDIKTGKLDYVLPLSGKAKLSLGWKSSFVTSDNNAQYFNWIDNSWKTDSSVTNHFVYKEDIHAGYINFNKDFAKGWSIQLGLRGEQTVSNGHQYIGDSTVKRNYFQLFPTVFLQKKVGEDNTYGLTYNRRIMRPDYEDLNPFVFYLDPYTYQVGNPFLQPQISNSIEGSYAYKSLLVASLNYTYTSAVITQLLKQDDATRATYQTTDNLGSTGNISLNVSLNIPVTKWWTSNNSINAWRNIINAFYMDEPLKFRKNTVSYNVTNTFTLPKGFKAELSGFYNSAAIWGLFQAHSQYQVNFGLQKSLFKDNATIKVNVNDIFRVNKFYADAIYGNVNTQISNRWDSRRLNVSFTWRFKQGASIKTRSHDGNAADDEQSRIKSK
ncbi:MULTISPECIES: TonB-dependent receptor domain-containing protein [Chitinophagaceae]